MPKIIENKKWLKIYTLKIDNDDCAQLPQYYLEFEGNVAWEVDIGHDGYDGTIYLSNGLRVKRSIKDGALKYIKGNTFSRSLSKNNDTEIILYDFDEDIEWIVIPLLGKIYD